MKTYSELPIHAVPESAQQLATEPGLRIEGLVSEPRLLKPADLATLPRASFTENFSCDEQWSTTNQTWSGPRLLDVLNLAGLLPTAKYVRVGAGAYVVPVLLQEATQALLADMLNDQPISLEHGAPWRLALPGARCFTSVKWVDRLELVAARGANTGARITSTRLRANRTSAPD
jgi:DMSO/TMAO reductase YedYZ molybdopterin-dependent catalytic subunit